MTKANEKLLDHWTQHANHWSHVGVPLRPSEQDIATFESLLANCRFNVISPGKAVLMGVTPELASMQWPESIDLLSIDRCLGMIQGVWPGANLPFSSLAVQGDWCHMPLANSVIDIVIGDGCFTLLTDIDNYRDFIKEIKRVMQPDGQLLIRAFVRPMKRECPEAVIADLISGQISSFHAFKWRLAMALHGDLGSGVRLKDIWEAWHAENIDTEALSAQRGWSSAEINTINVYRNVDSKYTFPLLDELRAIIGEQFEEIACIYGDYELADRCPILAFKPKHQDTR